MSVKRKGVLSREDFREALDSHTISISQVAKATGVPRTYLSEFLSIGRPLKPEQLQKIRDFLESEGVEFDDAPASDPADAPAPPPGLAIASLYHFAIHPDRMEKAAAVMQEIQRNDERITELLNKEAKRKTNWAGDPVGFTESTADDLRELFARAGANYFMFRYLTGIANPLEQGEKQDTIRAVTIETITDSLVSAGIDVAPEPAPEEEEPA